MTGPAINLDHFSVGGWNQGRAWPGELADVRLYPQVLETDEIAKVLVGEDLELKPINRWPAK